MDDEIDDMENKAFKTTLDGLDGLQKHVRLMDNIFEIILFEAEEEQKRSEVWRMERREFYGEIRDAHNKKMKAEREKNPEEIKKKIDWHVEELIRYLLMNKVDDGVRRRFSIEY